jgi:hypothetical protein
MLAVDFDCSFQNALHFRPGCRRHGAGASISGIRRPVCWLGCMFARIPPPAAAVEECQKHCPYRPATTLAVGLFVRIALSNYNGLL